MRRIKAGITALARPTRRRSAENGAVAVESALIGLLLITFVFGVLEFGLLVSKRLLESSATRAGARVAAAAGTAGNADFQILQAVRNAVGFTNLDDVDLVVVYRDADTTKFDVQNKCKKGIPVAGVCNVYYKDDFKLTAQQLFETGRTQHWASTSRVQFVDSAGVYLSVQHNWLTGLFSTKKTTVGDFTVMQVQPNVQKPWMPSTTTAAPTTTTPTVPPPPTASTVAPSTTTTKAPTTTTAAPTTTSTTAAGGGTTSTSAPPTTTTVKPTTTAAPTTTTSPPPTVRSF